MTKKHQIALFAPSGNITTKDLQDVLQYLAKNNINPKYSKLITAKDNFFAGTIEQRKQQISELLDCDIFFAIRGGSGAMNLLPFFDELNQQKKLQNIKFIGFSDISVFLNYLATKGSIAIHSHLATTLKEADSYEKKLFFSKVFSDKKSAWGEELAGEKQKQLTSLQKGQAEGILLGGNLAIISSLIGTAWQVDFSSKIVFFEDEQESYQRIERCFSQLYYANCLKNIKGLVLGNFIIGEKELECNKIFNLIKDFLPKDIPVLANFPAGHKAQNAPLPIGAKIFLNSSKKEFFVTDERLLKK